MTDPIPPQRFTQDPKPAKAGSSVKVSISDFTGISWPLLATVTWTFADGSQGGFDYECTSPLDSSRTFTIPTEATSVVITCAQSQDYSVIFA